MDLIRAAATNLVELTPDAIMAVGGRVIPLLMEATRTVPIVVPGGADPVERGWIKTFARPGGKANVRYRAQYSGFFLNSFFGIIP